MQDDVLKNVLEFVKYNFVTLGVMGHDIDPGTYVCVDNGVVVASPKDGAAGYTVDHIAEGMLVSLDLSCGQVFSCATDDQEE